MFGEVPAVLDGARSPKQRWLGDEGPSLGPLPRPGLLGPLAVTVAVGRGAGPGGAPLEPSRPEPLGCICGCPLAFLLGEFPAPALYTQRQGFGKTWVVVWT